MILLSLKKIKGKLLANISYNLYILYRYQTIKNINFNVDGNDKQNQSTDQSVESNILILNLFLEKCILK
jgi:hypothetical protein